jgi:excisionase family DNA binding protein
MAHVHKEISKVMNELMTYKQAAEYLHLSEGGVRLLVKRKLIPVCKVPGTVKVVRIRKSELDRLMSEGEVETEKEAGEGVSK